MERHQAKGPSNGGLPEDAHKRAPAFPISSHGRATMPDQTWCRSCELETMRAEHGKYLVLKQAQTIYHMLRMLVIDQ